MLVLLIGVVCVYTVDMGSNSMMYIPSFMKILLSIQAILKFRLRRSSVGSTNGKEL
jgi:hypothetical protein